MSAYPSSSRSQIFAVLSREPETMQSFAVTTARTSSEWPKSSVDNLKSSIFVSILQVTVFGLESTSTSPLLVLIVRLI